MQTLSCGQPLHRAAKLEPSMRDAFSMWTPKRRGQLPAAVSSRCPSMSSAPAQRNIRRREKARMHLSKLPELRIVEILGLISASSSRLYAGQDPHLLTFMSFHRTGANATREKRLHVSARSIFTF